MGSRGHPQLGNLKLGGRPASSDDRRLVGADVLESLNVGVKCPYPDSQVGILCKPGQKWNQEWSVLTPPRTEPAQHRPCLGSSRCGVQGERQDITAAWEVQGQRTGWGHPPPLHRHANTRLISEITEHLLYAGLRSKHGPSCACCRVVVTGGHLLFPFHRSTSRGSEIPFVPREGLKVGLAAQGARRVTSHDPIPTSLP